jgi:molybdopterin-guanine dinucleotide biosynthesis protein B
VTPRPARRRTRPRRPPSSRSRSATHPIVGVVGRQNVGKTTFLTKLLPALRARGLRVAVIKHGPHGFEIDRPGKDTYEIRRTGVEQTLIVGAELLAVVERLEREPPLEEVIARHVRPEVDLVVCEGYKREPHPRIEVARAAVSRDLVLADEDLFAVVADFTPPTTRPVYPPDEAGPVAKLIVEQVLRR